MTLDIYKGKRAEDFRTPREFMYFLHKKFHFTPYLDVCASLYNTKAPFYYSEAENCLEKEWYGQVWMNPPYGRSMPKFLAKCNEQIKNKAVNSIFALVPARTDTKWFHDIVCKGASEVHFIRGRFNFQHKSTIKNSNAPFASILIIWNKERYHNETEFYTLDVPKKYRGF